MKKQILSHLRKNQGIFILPVLLAVLLVGFGLVGYFVIKKNEVGMAEKKEIQMASQQGAEDLLRRYSYLVNRTNENNWRIGAIVDGYKYESGSSCNAPASVTSCKVQVWKRKKQISAYRDTGAYSMSYFYYPGGDLTKPPIYVRVPDQVTVDLSTGKLTPSGTSSGKYNHFNNCSGIRVENIPLADYYGPNSSRMVFGQVIVRTALTQHGGKAATPEVYCSPDPLAFDSKTRE